MAESSKQYMAVNTVYIEIAVYVYSRLALGLLSSWYHAKSQGSGSGIVLCHVWRHQETDSLFFHWLRGCLAPNHQLHICWTILNGTLGTHFSKIRTQNKTVFLQKMHLKMAFAKCELFCSSPIVWIVISSYLVASLQIYCTFVWLFDRTLVYVEY